MYDTTKPLAGWGNMHAVVAEVTSGPVAESWITIGARYTLNQPGWESMLWIYVNPPHFRKPASQPTHTACK